MAILAFVAYLPALRSEFVWDDIPIQTEQAPGITLSRAFGFGGGVQGIPKVFYRPVVLVSYLFDEKLNAAFAENPAGRPGGRLDSGFALIPHFSTMLVHAVASALAFLLCLRLLRRRFGERDALFGAAVAGGVFALHPAHAESVALVAGRSDSLAAAFLFGALLLAVRGADEGRPGAQIVGGALFLFALLSKEVAVPGLLLCPILLLAVSEKRKPGEVAGSAAVLSFGLAFAAYWVLRVLAGYGLGEGREGGLARTAWGVASAFGWYLRNLVWPLPVTAFAPETDGVPATIAFVAAFATACWLAARAWRRGDRLPALSAAFFALTVAPSLAVAVQGVADAPVAQRYLYLPVFGLALALGWGAAKAGAGKAVGAACVAALLAFGALVWTTADAWRTNRGFWAKTVEDESAARFALPWLNLAQTYLTPTELHLAERYYRRALDAPHRPDAEDRALGWYGLGNVAFNRAQLDFRQGRSREAALNLEEADGAYSRAIGEGLAAYPIFFRSRGEANLMRAFLLRGQTLAWDRGLLGYAGSDLTTAARLMPGDPDTLRLLAKLRSYGGM